MHSPAKRSPMRRSAVRFRPAGRRDLAWLAALERASFVTDALTPAELRRLIAGGRARVEVLADEEGDAGALVLKARPNRGALYIYSLAVQPERRGRGHGARLVARAVELARDQGLPRLELEVRADDGGAMRLYRRAGFRPRGLRPHWYGDGAAALTATRPVRGRAPTLQGARP